MRAGEYDGRMKMAVYGSRDYHRGHGFGLDLSCYIETNLNSPSARFAHTQIVQDPMAKAFHFRY